MSDGRGAGIAMADAAPGAVADEASSSADADADQVVVRNGTLAVPASDLPRWALVVGALLAALFVELSMQAYFGRSTVDRLASIVPAREQLADTTGLRAVYVPREEHARRGTVVIDTDGRDRPLVAGDLVLVGDRGRLVRLERDRAPTTLDAATGSAISVVNLGPWDAANRQLGGLTATAGDGRWELPRDTWPAAGRDFRGRGSQTELPNGFWRSPGDAPVRTSRQRDADGQYYRFEISRSMPYLVVTSRDPLGSVDNAPITVRAIARAQSGAMLTLTVYDVLDAAGQAESKVERRPASGDWEELRLSMRTRFASQGDNFSVGLFEAQPNDWLEVRSLELFLGLLP